MAEGEDNDQKTEQPTQKRITEALEKGNIPYSREINHFLILCVLALIIGGFAPSILHNTKLLLMPFLADADSIPTDNAGLGHVLSNTLAKAALILMVPFTAVVCVGLFSRFSQGSFVLTMQPLSPKWDRISPMAGFKRLFSMRSLVELIKNVFKFAVVSIIGYMAIAPQLDHIKQLPDSSVLTILMFLGKLATNMMIGVLIATFFIALFDLIYQRFQYYKQLRMTKQEIKDEYKQMEGDPKIKQKLRQLRMERARKRMMAAVPESDVVITNPTHYAVALKYDSTNMKAPMVIAKGQDLVAFKIREVAEENDVPIVENPPLARALYTSTEIDQEIPTTHYEAVAKVISYVYQLKGKKL
jgi:flagellar biosynthesis protein FlhB